MSQKSRWTRLLPALFLVTTVLAWHRPPAQAQQQPNIFVRSSQTRPEVVAPGGQVTLVVELHNVGGSTAFGVMARFSGEGFVPVGSSTVKNIPFLQPDEHGWVEQAIQVSTEVTGDMMPVTVDLQYTDADGVVYTSSEEVGVKLLVPTPTPTPRPKARAGQPQLVIDSFLTEPPLPVPGQPFTLTLTLHNVGAGAARHVLLTNGASSTYAPLGAGNVTAVGSIDPGATLPVSLRLVADKSTEPGLHIHQLVLDYDSTAGDPYSSAQNVAIELGKGQEQPPEAQPLVVLNSYRVQPAELSPGQPFTLTLVVQNVGSGPARQVTLTIDDQQAADKAPSIAPLGSGNVRFLASLEAGALGEVVTHFIVDGAAGGGVHVMKLDLAYQSPPDKEVTRSEQLSLVVVTHPQLQASFYGPVEGLLVGQPFDLPIEIYNVGRSRLNSNLVEVVSQDLEIVGKPVYAGPIDAGTSVGIDGQQALADSEGTKTLTVTVHYIDDFNQVQAYELEMTVSVEPMPELEPGLLPGEPGLDGMEPPLDAAPRPFLVRLLLGLLGLGSG